MTKAALQEAGIFYNDKRFDPSRRYKNCKHMKPTYIPNNKKKKPKTKIHEAKFTEFKGKIDNSIIIVGEYSAPFSVKNRTIRGRPGGSGG